MTTNGEDTLEEAIIAANIQVHAKEAATYERFHTEIFNVDEQNRILRDLSRVKSMLSSVEEPNALDVGSGTGNIALKMAAWRWQVIALDLSSEMLAILQNRADAELPEDNLICVCENVTDYLREAEAQWNVITFSSVLHHLPNYYETLSLAAEHLSIPGILYIVHEPLRHKRVSTLSRIIKKPLRKLFQLKLMRDNVQIPKIDYSLSDYHVEPGIDLFELTHFLESKGLKIASYARYSVERFGLWARIRNQILKEYDHFSLMANRSE